MHDERAAFERNIDENPLDATNHLVYADWLDEHGEPDEAAFRRAMGEWHQNGGISYHRPTHNPWAPPWYTLIERYPKWLSADNMDVASRRRRTGSHEWRNYSDIESAARREFMASRQQQRPEQLSRRRLARRKYGISDRVFSPKTS